MFGEIIKNTVMITSFVMVMMLIIEYVNVQTRGKWNSPLQKNKWMQLLFAAILGIIPGCLGTYTVVSLYTHNILGFGALVTNMIATSGDEAFVMFSIMPETAIKLTIIIFLIAIATGFVINIFAKKRKSLVAEKAWQFKIHEEDEVYKCFDKGNIINHFKKITFPRFVIIIGLIGFIIGLVMGEFSHDHSGELPNQTEHVVADNHTQHEHDHDHTGECDHAEGSHDHGGEWDWIRVTFLVCSLIALFVVSTVPDHFLEVHLWGHIIKKHFFKIFLWTFAALLAVAILLKYIDINSWIDSNYFYILIIALLVGLIPESGPHLIFVSLYFSGTIPFSILLANSIVQDGHGALPLFAESKRSFIMMKLINFAVGLVVGVVAYNFGW